MQLVDDPRCPRKIPRYLLELPWASDDDPIAERIIAQILAAPDPWKVQADDLSTSGQAQVGKRAVVYDIRVHPSSKPGGWGAYLICDATVAPDEDTHTAITVGAKQAVTLLALAWAYGELPIAGTFTVATETDAGNQVLSFVREDGF
jgi:hypothetical protein